MVIVCASARWASVTGQRRRGSAYRLPLLRIYARLKRHLSRLQKMMSGGSGTPSQMSCGDPVWARRENAAAKLEGESDGARRENAAAKLEGESDTRRIFGSQEEPRGPTSS